MIRKWLVTAIACGFLAAGLAGCEEPAAKKEPPVKADTKAPAKVDTAKKASTETPAKAKTETKEEDDEK